MSPAALNGLQVLALWELVLTGDGKTTEERAVKLDPSEVAALGALDLRAVAVRDVPVADRPVCLPGPRGKLIAYAVDVGSEPRATPTVVDELPCEGGAR